MITPSHLIYSWALAKGTETVNNPARTRWFVFGGLAPDIPIYLLFVVHTFILGTSQAELWDTIYFNSAWTPFLTLFHSWLLWPTLLLIGYYTRQSWLRWLSFSAFVHTVLDFLVHNDDAYRHLWPLSDWKFMSPISYWDPNHFGTIVGAADTVIILLLLVWLGYRYQSRRAQLSIGFIMLLYLLITVVPYLIF